jgi:hypothetical protein
MVQDAGCEAARLDPKGVLAIEKAGNEQMAKPASSWPGLAARILGRKVMGDRSGGSIRMRSRAPARDFPSTLRMKGFQGRVIAEGRQHLPKGGGLCLDLDAGLDIAQFRTRGSDRIPAAAGRG